MTNLPNSISISLWVVGASWALALLAYIFGGDADLIFPLFMLGVLTGIAEWCLRRNAG